MCECDCVCVGVIVLMGVGVIVWVREGVGGTSLIAAVKYVCVWGEGEVEGGVCVCDCVGESV